MSNNRGILYICWGDKIQPYLERSIASVKAIYPELPIKVIREDGWTGLEAKTLMGARTPFKSTLYLDADTVLLGNVDFAFERAEQFGMACCICEAPWMRRYGQPAEAEMIEYNTGVLFFTKGSGARRVFSHWQTSIDIERSRSRWRMQHDQPGYVRGLQYDDQASFARAIAACEFNPYVLPINYNLRPAFHRSLFAPVKIWHDYSDVPAVVRDTSRAIERGEQLVTHMTL